MLKTHIFKTLTKVDRNQNAVFLLTCKWSKRASVSSVTWVSCDLKTSFVFEMARKMEKCVATLLTILISLLAVYQLNCLLIVLNYNNVLTSKSRSFKSNGVIPWSDTVILCTTKAWYSNPLYNDDCPLSSSHNRRQVTCASREGYSSYPCELSTRTKRLRVNAMKTDR